MPVRNWVVCSEVQIAPGGRTPMRRHSAIRSTVQTTARGRRARGSSTCRAGLAAMYLLPHRTIVVNIRSTCPTIDADHAFGRSRFARGGAKLEDVIDLFQAGASLQTVAEEFGLTQPEVEDVLRVATRAAA